MVKYMLALLVVLFSTVAFGQVGDTVKVKRETFDDYKELKTKQIAAGVDELTYLDSTFGFQARVPAWLNLQETGTVHVWGGTLPAVDGIENAIAVKIYNKNRFATLSDFKKYVIEGLTFGQMPPWSKTHTFMGKKELGKYKQLGDAYKLYLKEGNLIYHCEYVLLETKTAYLWIDFAATPTTFDTNKKKFEEFLDGIKVF